MKTNIFHAFPFFPSFRSFHSALHPLFQKDHQAHHHFLSCLLISLVMTHTYIVGSSFLLYAATGTETSPQMHQMIEAYSSNKSTVTSRAKSTEKSTGTSLTPVTSSGTIGTPGINTPKDTTQSPTFTSAPVNPGKTLKTLEGIKVDNLKVYEYKGKYILYWSAPKKSQSAMITDYVIRYKKEGEKGYRTYTDGVHKKNYAILSGFDKKSGYSLLVLPKTADSKSTYAIASTTSTSRSVPLSTLTTTETKNSTSVPKGGTTPVTGNGENTGTGIVGNNRSLGSGGGSSGGSSGGGSSGGGNPGGGASTGGTLVNGSCGSTSGTTVITAPITSLCSTGISSSVVTNANLTIMTGAYTWSCIGANGGTTMSCSANRTGSGSGSGGSNPIPPTISIIATPNSVAYSGTSVITWTSTNATSCTKSWGANGTGGTYTTPVLTTNTTYAISCTGTGGTATGSVSVTVGPQPPLTPTISIIATPNSVAYSGTSVITWTSTNATSCTKSWGANGTGGTYTTPVLTTSTTYSLSCTGTGGTVTGSVVVGVGSAPIAGQNPILTGIAPGKARHLGVYNPPLLANCGKTAAGITDYSRFNYNSDKKSMMMFGGGHATIPRTDVDVLNLTLSGLTWISDYPSTPILEQIPSNFNSGNATWITTGHPTSRHTYDQTVYVPETQELIILGAHGPLPSCGNVGVDDDPQGKVAHYNTNTKIWTMGADINWKFTYPAVEYDPISKKIILVGRSGMQIYDPITRIVSQALTYSNGGLEIVQNLIYYPPNRKMYYMLNNGRVFEVTLNRTNFSLSTIIEVTGITGTVPPRILPSTGSDAGETGFAYDSENQIIGGGVVDGIFYAYNPLTKVWNAQVMESISPMTNIGSMSVSHVIDYDDFNKVFIFISLSRDPLYPNVIYSWNTWAYKYNGVTFNAPPTPPTVSIIATPNSVAYSGTSVITWTSTNATSCTKSWGANGTGGTYTTPVLTSSTTYSLSCTGTGGTATGNITVNVGNAPIQPGGVYKYRNQSPYLFQTVTIGRYLSRIPAFPNHHYYADIWGPDYLSVDPQAGWQWRNPGGDWIDKNLMAQGTGAWASFAANAVAGSTAIHTYTGTDVTALVQYVQSNSKWLAIMVTNTGGARAAGGIVTPGQTPPSIDIVYADSSTGTLRARIVALDSRSSALPVTTAQSLGLPVFIEFDRPIKPVSSAKLTFTITAHWSGNATVQIFLLDPSMNNEPSSDTSGLASLAGPLDTGLASIPGILGAHRYVDGSTMNNFFVEGWNTSNESNYDPAIWGGVQDLTKWPHTAKGKWVTTYGSLSGISLVPSSYSGEGFTPLAPGIGAMRLHMPAFPVVDNQEVSKYGRLAGNLFLFMDEPDFGRLDRIFVRYYVRMGTPYAPHMNDRKHILSSTSPRWTDMSGKMGIGPSHATSYGGVSGSSGGPYGWQMRQGWMDSDAGQGGPDEGGVTQGFHLYDFQSNNPAGHRYGVEKPATFERWGQKGGLGSMMYAGAWYEVETELKLNTVFTGSNTYLPDGEMRAWVDGRLVWEGTGMVFRTLPLYNPGFAEGRMRPARELGIKELWLNWFHGGQSENTYARTMFYSNVAWAKSRIGKMQSGTGGVQ